MDRMRIFYVRTSLFVFCFVVLSLLFAVQATAQEPTGAFIVHPARVELALSPGKEMGRDITLSNNTNAPLHVEVSFEDIAPSTQYSFADDPVLLVEDKGGRYSLREFISTPKVSFDILSGAEVILPITVRIPKDAEPGGRYGSVVIDFSPALPEGGGSKVKVNGRVAALLFVRVEGEVKEEGKLTAFGLFNNARVVRSPSNDAPVRFQVAYENTGTVHLNPYGRVTLTDLSGRKQTTVIPPWPVLPGATRMLEVDVLSPLFPGYYKANLELNRGYENIVDDREVRFWVIPGLRGTLILIVVLIGLGWLLKRSWQISRHFVR